MIVYVDDRGVRHEITAIVYRGSDNRTYDLSSWITNTQILWEAVRSCFGSGSWREDKPYIEKEAWKES